MNSIALLWDVNKFSVNSTWWTFADLIIGISVVPEAAKLSYCYMWLSDDWTSTDHKNYFTFYTLGKKDKNFSFISNNIKKNLENAQELQELSEGGWGTDTQEEGAMECINL